MKNEYVFDQKLKLTMKKEHPFDLTVEREEGSHSSEKVTMIEEMRENRKVESKFIFYLSFK